MPPLRAWWASEAAQSASVSSLAHGLIETGAATVTVVEPPDGPARPAERTRCCWDEDGGDFDEAVAATWLLLRVHGPRRWRAHRRCGRRVTAWCDPPRTNLWVHARLACSSGGACAARDGAYGVRRARRR
ncbi:lycopene cyclase family protein [Streptomyces coeruleofuscus]|uniref:lycopene cyclase family protein n=1 Tax=Streptomyces coeruleofuscus TaxID=66879 RepID=UPI003D1546D6